MSLAALVDHVETAEFDNATLQAFDGALEDAARDALLEQAGYQLADRLLSPGPDPEPQVWVAARGHTRYQPASGFYRPLSQRTSLLTEEVTYAYDNDVCVLTGITDALDNQTIAGYDYRFLQVTRIVDANANTGEVLLDALGGIVASSFYGHEEFLAVGFSPVADFSPAGLTLTGAIQNAGVAAQPVASIQIDNPFSWMGQQLTQASLTGVTQDVPGLWSVLQACGFITPEGWILAAGRAWADGDETRRDIPDPVRALMQAAERLSVLVATLVADRYPSGSRERSLLRRSGASLAERAEVARGLRLATRSARGNRARPGWPAPHGRYPDPLGGVGPDRV
ncbi:MAG: hypothetical protein CPSOU_6765 [uncultured Paraburkholderia sp.]|nr:MAG: hypothetical protein CPSOU_6765 [uncultured Paraburkholderia sp.]